LRRESRRLGQNECIACYSKKHYSSECPVLRKVRAAELQKKEPKEKVDKVEIIAEASNVALAEETDSDAYYPLYPPTAAMISSTPIPWAIDSDASRHFTGTLSDFTLMKRWHTERSVRIANGTLVPAIGTGSVKLGSFTLNDVWYVPDFKSTRLISVHTLTKEGYTVLFDEGDKATCIHKNTGTRIFEALIRNGLYTVYDTQEAYQASEPLKQPTQTIEMGPLHETDADLWHRRLAHTNHKDIQKLATASEGLKFKRRPTIAGHRACEGCLAGKMKESYNKKTSSRITQPGRKLYADLRAG
jgi:hypothetical protein